MKTKPQLTFILSAIALAAFTVSAQAQTIIASDIASNYSAVPNVGDGFHLNGTNLGTGFQPWQISIPTIDPHHTAGDHGFLAVGNGAYSGSPYLFEPYDGWGGPLTAVRPFTASLGVGETFSMDMLLGPGVNVGGSFDGFSLENSSGTSLIKLAGAVGQPYQITDAGNTAFNIGLTGDTGGASHLMTNFAITLDSATTYTLNVTGGDLTLPAAYNGTFSGTISQLDIFAIPNPNVSSGWYANNLLVTAPVPEPSTYAMMLGGLGLLIVLRGFVSRKA